MGKTGQRESTDKFLRCRTRNVGKVQKVWKYIHVQQRRALVGYIDAVKAGIMQTENYHQYYGYSLVENLR